MHDRRYNLQKIYASSSMCKTHNFLMITNCDFLSNDIVLARSVVECISSSDLEMEKRLVQQSQSSCNSSHPARVEIVAMDQARTAKVRVRVL